MEFDASPSVLAPASATPDVGLGSVWPTAVLGGASLAAAAAAGAWVAAALTGARPAWSLPVWSAEHALWGTAAGAVVALALRLAERGVPALAVPARRRVVGLWTTAALVSLGLALVLGILGARAAELAPAPLLGALGGAALWLAGARRTRPAQGLARLDPARVAALLALGTLPLANGLAAGRPASLLEVWRLLLGS